MTSKWQKNYLDYLEIPISLEPKYLDDATSGVVNDELPTPDKRFMEIVYPQQVVTNINF